MSEMSSAVHSHSTKPHLFSWENEMRVQRKLSFDDLSAEGVELLHQFVDTQGQALLDELDCLLSVHRSATPSNSHNPGQSTGIGMYVFHKSTPLEKQ